MASAATTASVTLVGGLQGLKSDFNLKSFSAQQYNPLFGGSISLQKSSKSDANTTRSQGVATRASCGPCRPGGRFSTVRDQRGGRPTGRRTSVNFSSPWGAFELMPGVVMGGCGPQPLNYRTGQMGNLTQFLATLMREVPRTIGVRGWDVHESNSAWTMTVELPGFGPEDVSVELADNILNITATQRKEGDEEDETNKSRFSTRASANFSTRLPLPDAIQVEDISAEVDRGVLTVTLPKKVVKQPKKTVVTVKVKGDSASASASASTPVSSAKETEDEKKKAEAGFEPGEDTSRWDALDAENDDTSAKDEFKV